MPAAQPCEGTLFAGAKHVCQKWPLNTQNPQVQSTSHNISPESNPIEAFQVG
jgi:hypothetical protein